MKRIVLVGIGILAVLFGLIWIGQGSGYFPYPASSFMIAQPQWMLYGAILAVAGVAAIVAGRRM
jgi:hypothetical protein